MRRGPARDLLRRSARLFMLCALLACSMAAPAREALPLAADPALESRMMGIAEELRCLVCQNETLAASQADLAVDLRGQIMAQLRQGQSKSQILDYMVQRYGAFVRYRPAFDLTTALLWIGPFALLVLVTIVLANNIFRRRAAPFVALGTADLALEESPLRATTGSPRSTYMLTLFVPIFSIALYALLGNPAGLRSAPSPVAATQADADVSKDDLQAMLATLAKRLETPSADPTKDAQGWTMLARSYAALQRFEDADRAFARAIALAPGDAQLLADRADVLSMVQGQRTTGEPDRLIAEALRLDPRNLKALALAGTAAFERRDAESARRYWQQARAMAQDGSDFAVELDRSLAEVGAPTMPTPATEPARITGRVSLAPELAARAAPSDVVFVFARAVDGRMPLAILRRTVADLPFDFTLDDSLSMSPQASLSGTQRVVVGARVSRSGNAMPQPNDLSGVSAEIANRTEGLELSIDRVQP